MTMTKTQMIGNEKDLAPDQVKELLGAMANIDLPRWHSVDATNAPPEVISTLEMLAQANVPLSLTINTKDYSVGIIITIDEKPYQLILPSQGAKKIGEALVKGADRAKVMELEDWASSSSYNYWNSLISCYAMARTIASTAEEAIEMVRKYSEQAIQLKDSMDKDVLAVLLEKLVILTEIKAVPKKSEPSE